MQDVKKLLKDIDEHNKKVKSNLEKKFYNTIADGTKEFFPRIVGIKKFGYSKKYAENYDKIKWH